MKNNTLFISILIISFLCFIIMISVNYQLKEARQNLKNAEEKLRIIEQKVWRSENLADLILQQHKEAKCYD